MIHTVVVLSGEGDCARAAQQHALEVARLFRARLRVLVTREPEDTQARPPSGPSMEAFAEREAANLSQDARNAGVTLETCIRGEGLLKGLLAEARENDLLVVGLPPQGTKDADPLLQAVSHAEWPLLHRAECMVLVVHQHPQPIGRILVDYQGGTEGKDALRAAGEVAIRASAAVTVLSVDGDRSIAEALSTTAERYLAGFGLASIQAIEQVGQSGDPAEVARVAESTAADLIVIGGERHGLLNWLRDLTTADPHDVAVLTQIPVLVAR